MAYYNQFEFAPAPWLPIQDRQVLDSVGKKAFDAHIGKAFDNPDFELSIVPDVNNYFAIDLFCRIRCSDVENKKLVVILPFLSVLWKTSINTRLVVGMFTYSFFMNMRTRRVKLPRGRVHTAEAVILCAISIIGWTSI